MDTTFKEAIHMAEAGGYQPIEAECTHILMNDESGCPFGFHYAHWKTICFERSFWESLGYALGWNALGDEYWEKRMKVNDSNPASSRHPNRRWHQEMLNFIDHIASGGEVSDFFRPLLK